MHSKEQGRALGSLLKAVTDEFKEIIPQELNKIYRNITDIVLSDKIPRYTTLSVIFLLLVKVIIMVEVCCNRTFKTLLFVDFYKDIGCFWPGARKKGTLNFWKTLIVSPGITDNTILDLFWHLPWASKPGWIPCLQASIVLHAMDSSDFTSGVTPADLFVGGGGGEHGSQAILIHLLAHVQALVGLEPRINCVV